MAYIRHSRPISGFGFQVNVVTKKYVLHFRSKAGGADLPVAGEDARESPDEANATP